MRKKRIIFSIVCVLILITSVSFIYSYNNYPISLAKPKEFVPNGRVILNKNLSKEKVLEDREELINIIEDTHPIFLDGVNKKYREAKDRFIKNTNKEMLTSDFQVEVSKYLTSLEDKHTSIGWKEDEKLNVNWIYLDSKLKLLDKDDNLTNQEVVEINGVNIKSLKSGINEIFPYENYSGENKNIENYLKGKKVLEYLGVKPKEEVKLKIKEGNNIKNISISFIRNISKPLNREIYGKKIDKDNYYIKFQTCTVNDSLNTLIDNLKGELNNGVKNVIVDVRDNPGGDSKACEELLNAMGMECGSFSQKIRYSKLAKEQRGYLKETGYVDLEGSNYSKKNENIKLYVITNANTFSSATWLGTLVRDGNLGLIVGSSSENMPSSYGDIIQYQLKNSKIIGMVSHKKFIRPNKEKSDEKTLEPDIKLKFYEDPVSYIVNMNK